MNNNYQVLARKWRPKNFADMVGQLHVVKTLAHALDTLRLHHAYLLTGTRGVGKTTLGRIIAKCLNCEQGITSKPCETCNACTAIDAGRFIDLIEIDAASRTKVEDTRDLLDNVPYAPTAGRFKVYLIDEVHMLSGHSFNALLKTLEEPPAHVKFILATTDPQRLPVTILSRCLQFHLKHLSPEEIAKHLQFVLEQEKIPAEADAIKRLSISAAGSMRDALSLTDQAIAFGNGNVTLNDVQTMLGTIDHAYIQQLLTALQQKDSDATYQAIVAINEVTSNYQQLIDELILNLHHLSVAQQWPQAVTHLANAEQIVTLAKQFNAQDLQLYYQIALIGRRDLSLCPSMQAGFEMLILRMLSFAPATSAAATTSAAVEEIKPKPVVAAPTTTNASTPWQEIVAQLNLTGMAQALAQHCAIKKFTEQQIDLLLTPSQLPLLSERTQARLATALCDHLQRKIKLTITAGPADTPTPAYLDSQSKQQKKAEVLADENVQALLNEFDATVT